MPNTHFPWVRFAHGDTPVYFSRQGPNWFVPNRTADDILRKMVMGASPNGNLNAMRLLSRLPETPQLDYTGRSGSLSLERIGELWFHLTNRCNMRCSHCLFSSSPDDGSEISTLRVLDIAAEARNAGCGLFVLTGGEPLVHPGIDEIVGKLLGYDQTHVVMLTNGLAVRPFLSRLQPDPEFFHLQISLDGLGATHDKLRGKDAFAKLCKLFHWLKNKGYPYTIAMCVTSANVHEMPGIVDLAADMGASNVHYMWYFVRGRAKQSGVASVDTIFDSLVASSMRGKKRGIPVDNIEAMKTQIFAPAGTIHDGSTAGWVSLAVGPEEKLYPSAALVGIEALASEMGSGLVDTWQRSPVLQKIRNSTVAGGDSPLRFILGGGDIDHSYLHGKKFLGEDPYLKLYEKIALWLVSREAEKQKQNGQPSLLLQMGEILESCGAHGKIALVHSNCLLATAQNDSLTTIKAFYAEAVADSKIDILNPVCYETALIDHIPEQYRFRGYGCGSPIMDAHIQEGETVVDLGCGGGVECFIASRLCASKGKVVGIDMLDPMLDLANAARPQVAKNLGYDNIEFKKGYLEALPLEDDSADVAISNCVMNLSVHKRKSYAEIFRVLRPGGRLVISDVVCDTEPDPAIRNDEVLKGECIAGALTASHLVGLLEETGFEAVTLVKRFAYRKVNGHPFFSLTYSAIKPKTSGQVDVIYRGPLPFLMTQGGTLLRKGVVAKLDRSEADWMGDQVFVLDESGTVMNVVAENTCACYVAPEEKAAPPPADKFALAPLVIQDTAKKTMGCMVCGSPLIYARDPQDRQCAFCGVVFSANTTCEKGHYVCDQCHTQDAVEVIRHICLQTDETDVVRLFETIRSHPSIAMHGPEYHAMIPGILLCIYRNLGGDISDKMIETGILRGKGVAGGFCGFMGICGAAVGVGVAFSLLLDANPVKPSQRSTVQGVTQAVLAQIAGVKAARCCQRDGFIALTKAAELSQTLLPVTLKAEYRLVCRQMHLNKECLGKTCVLHPIKTRG
ncbi:MAG: methyltransferase type 11 [Desulfatitalea sp. BRH_c12]|nr:MAG: methyltransferase type 11 [Desulfatitalea sp. BRH_c12]